MTRVTLTPLANLSNGTTATTTINANSTTVNNSFDRVLFLDGTQPNQMQAALDMNSNQIINLAPPATMNSPARLVDVASNPTIVVPGTGTSGHLVPFLDGLNTWAVGGSNTFAGPTTFTNTTTFNAGSIAGTAIANGGVTTTQIATNTVANSNLTQMATNTIKGNNTGGTANAADLTIAQVTAMFSAPNVQVLTSSGTYTTPANAKYLIIEMVGGGAGGSGGGTGGGASTAGGVTTFGSSLLTCNGGASATTSVGGAGGTSTGGNIVAISGGNGSEGAGNTATTGLAGGAGGVSFFGGNGAAISGGAGGNANGFGSGGGGGGNTGAVIVGNGGGAGGYIKHIITSPAGSYPYAVGTGGGGGTAGTTGAAGGSGFAGTIIVYAYFQ